MARYRVTRITFDELDIAKYPFSIDALEYIKELGFGPEDLKTSFGQEVLERAYNRIITLLSGNSFHIDHKRIELDILSFPVALMLVALTRDSYLARSYAVKEAKTASFFLEGEIAEKILYLAKKTFKWDVKKVITKEGTFIGVHFTDYLSNLPSTQDQWKLINRRLVKGYVLLKKNEIVRLLEEAVKKLVLEKIEELEKKLTPGDEVIDQWVEKLKEFWAPRRERIEFAVGSLSEISESDYPPCIRILLEKARNGENLSHAARFALATFLLNIGWDVDKVVEVFSPLPDFNESRTRYQVEHLAGLRGSRKKYSPFKCDNMRALNLCWPDEFCQNIKHPLQYFIRKRRLRRKKKKRGKEKLERKNNS